VASSTSSAPKSLSTARPAGHTPIDLEEHGVSKCLSSLEASGTWRITERNGRLHLFQYQAKR
jgi:hypothetical protein